MSKKIYKVIWFDDKWNDKNHLGYLERARRKQIELIGFTNAEEGIAELKKNYREYDGVLLDGLFYTDSEKTGDNIDEQALADVLYKLEGIEKKFKPFVLSGMTKFTSNENDVIKFSRVDRVYDKLLEQDLDDLWTDIKTFADQHIETQLRHQYANVFDFCIEEYIGEKAGSEILNTLLDLDNLANCKKHIRSIRDVIEDLFRLLHKRKLIPDDFVINGIAINETSKFLSGSKEKSYQLNQTPIPRIISESLKNILGIVQPANHRSEVDEYLDITNSNYLLKGILFQLFDVLIWFKNYIDSDPDIEDWELLEEQNIIGTIEQDEFGNFHCGNYLLNYKYTLDNYKTGDRIEITRWDRNTNFQTKDSFPWFVYHYKLMG